MQYLLFLAGALVGALGLFVSMIAASSIHQILGGVLLIVGAVLVSGAAIVESVDRLRNELRRAPTR